MSNIQEACETIEELINKSILDEDLLNYKEFLALNSVLLELAMVGKYKVPERFVR